MTAPLMDRVWDAYWDHGNTKLALERVVEVIQEDSKQALLTAHVEIERLTQLCAELEVELQAAGSRRLEAA
ncbi:hypothetical protein [Pseudochrobactrum sp. XF203]|uniref:hypothetical protein n=1 Tax=Pseudochrobactrum sp. XF203 TaxID=2879116 RepID=UPI001CE30B37|nr:hypothetical protein [Pseudochrobactrum sp. XF203]UCA47620.1 hypothetical protein LDL70_16330 [Pseudochrobactrum sp. XF203]